jgi:hypothetical protein
MKKHKYIIRFLVFLHLFFGVIAYFLIYIRMQYGGFIKNYLRFQEAQGGDNISIHTYIDGYILNPYLALIVALSILSSLFLIVKKTWGRAFSIVYGAILIPFGVFLFINNFGLDPNLTFFERFLHYFQYIGAFVGYVDLVCIFYGIFAIVYFTRKNVITFTKTATNTKLKSKIELQPESKLKTVSSPPSP